MGQIAENLEIIHAQIAKAAHDAGRDPYDVQLVAVSKVQPEARIEEALAAGQRCYGENRVQEAQGRWAERRAGCPELKLHLIGPLQTNKVKDAVALFDVIETVDREKLASALAKEMAKQGRVLPCFIQVNTGEEDQKAGIAPADLEDFYRFCVEACGLNVVGLMCIPPVDEPAALHFALLKKHADALGLSQLSMGMSADFETAIALGATLVRVGTGVFGARVAAPH
ncbi:MAG: YggS family pyridoxal phosphate-dependent enzyme [Rhodospirillales bacterium]|nr:YggS family pyridoxal phosphate-dependent enzyme [Rhodospirillales bacterium]